MKKKKKEIERHQTADTDRPTNKHGWRRKKRHNKVFPAKEREVGRCNKAFIFMTLSWGIFFFSSLSLSSCILLLAFFFFRLVDGTKERERERGLGGARKRENRPAMTTCKAHITLYHPLPSIEKTFTHRGPPRFPLFSGCIDRWTPSCRRIRAGQSHTTDNPPPAS